MKTPRAPGSEPDDLTVDAEVGHRLIEVKAGATALRSVRLGLMQLAYATAARPGFEGFLVLPDVAVTRKRLQREWQLAATALRPELLDRLSLCIGDEKRFVGIPRDPDAETQRILSQVVAAGRATAGPGRARGPARGSAAFVVLKILLHHWLTNGGLVTTEWLARSTGYSYPTIAGVLHGLGSLLERRSDRRLRLRWFPREEFARLLAGSDRARDTVRYGDRSGQPRSPEQHVRRLEQLAPAGVGIGGVLGAKYHFREFDLVGAPRLDLSQHCPRRNLDLRFIEELDPALKRVEDPLEPATVVVHAVRHADPLFTPREGGLSWADPVECLLDLHEAHLDPQAASFLDALQRSRPASP
jgi:hypothetical protein